MTDLVVEVVEFDEEKYLKNLEENEFFGDDDDFEGIDFDIKEEDVCK